MPVPSHDAVERGHWFRVVHPLPCTPAQRSAASPILPSSCLILRRWTPIPCDDLGGLVVFQT